MSIYKPESKKGDYSIARLKKGGEVYEIIIDSEAAIKVKQGKATINEALLVQKIFKDANKGDVHGHLTDAFGTDDVLKIAEEIIRDGEVQLSEDYRKKVVEQKNNQVIEELVKKAADPTTHYPIPRQRIELGIEKLGYKIRYEKSVKDMVAELSEALKEVMPITFKDIIVTINSPPQFSGQTYGAAKMGELIDQSYGSDGSLIIKLKIPASRKNDLRDRLKGLSHGQIKILEDTK